MARRKKSSDPMSWCFLTSHLGTARAARTARCRDPKWAVSTQTNRQTLRRGTGRKIATDSGKPRGLINSGSRSASTAYRPVSAGRLPRVSAREPARLYTPGGSSASRTAVLRIERTSASSGGHDALPANAVAP